MQGAIMIDTSRKNNGQSNRSSPRKQGQYEKAVARQHVEVCTEEDEMIDNPQKRIRCILCGKNGERKISGRLIPF